MPYHRDAKASERNKHYLFPGMGGRSRRRKQLAILGWSVFAGLVFSAIVASLLYWMYGN